MSYDYSLFKAPAPGPMASWPAVAPVSLGNVDELKLKIAEPFTGTVWSNANGTWFGRWEGRGRSAEFQMMPELDGAVRFIAMRRAAREDVERLCRHLDIVAIDPQRMELYSAGGWAPAR